MEIKKALFISQEISPYLPSSHFADLNRSVALGVLESGVEVRTFMPKYGMINERRNQLHEVIRLSGLNIIIDDSDHPLVIKVATLQPQRMQVYFIDNEDFFGFGDNTRLETEAAPEDNDERIMFFVRGAVETVKKLRWIPQLVHCSGWATALAPLYMRVIYSDDPTVRDSKIVYALHSNSFDGQLDPRFAEKLGLDGFSGNHLKGLLDGPVDKKMLDRIAIDYADAIIQADEDIDPETIEYAKASGKPFLAFPGKDEYLPAYLEFYKNL